MFGTCRCSVRVRTLSSQTGRKQGRPVHDIISDIIDWDQANKAYTAGEGQSNKQYVQRLEAAVQLAEIEARWHHLPDGFHGARKPSRSTSRPSRRPRR